MWGREKVRSEGYYHWLFVSLCPLVQRRYRMQTSVLWPFMSVNGQVVKCSLYSVELLFPKNHSRSFTINEFHGMLTVLFWSLTSLLTHLRQQPFNSPRSNPDFKHCAWETPTLSILILPALLDYSSEVIWPVSILMLVGLSGNDINPNSSTEFRNQIESKPSSYQEEVRRKPPSSDV